MKIVGGAIALFLAIFTLFGLSTWHDIKTETTQIVQAQAVSLLHNVDSDTGVKETLNNNLNTTVVNSYLAKHARSSGNELELTHNDWNRLREWIKREDLALQEFSDTLSVFNLQTETRKRSDSNRLLSEMLNPPERSQYNWILKQPEKIEAILSSFKHRSMGSSAASIVSSKSLTDSIRSKAAHYIKEVDYIEGVDSLLSDYKKLPWGDTKQQALISSFALRPDRDAVFEAVRELTQEEPTREKIDTVVSIISMIPSLSTSGEHSLSKEKKFRLSMDLIEYGISNGLYFEITRHDQRIALETNVNSKDPEPYVTILVKTSDTSASGLGRFSISEFDNLTAYWELLSESANLGDMEKFSILLPRESIGTIGDIIGIFGNNRLWLKIDADAKAMVSITEESGKESEFELRTLKDARIIGGYGIATSMPKILWISDQDGLRVGEINSLTGSDFSFSLESSN